VGFIYVDFKKLLSQRAEAKNAAPELTRSGELQINLNRDPQPPTGDRKSTGDPSRAITQIRENLDRLQSLHHKLHAVLDELSQVTDKKKRDW